MNTYDIAGMVKHYYETAGITPDPLTCGNLVCEEHEEWFEEWYHKEEENPEHELEELADKVYVEYGYALSKGWNLNEAIYRKHKVNLGRMYQDDGSIKRREDGKIIKNPLYPKVDLTDLVQEGT